MFLKSLFKNENGAVAVIVAISMTVLFGFSAMAVDVGMMASCRQSLQNAVDAAALAAAADIGAGRGFFTMKNTAAEYCRENGFDSNDDDLDLDVQKLGNSVTVTLSKNLKAGFSAVLTGSRVNRVSASAKAEVVSIFGGCPYALFAGQRIEDNGTGLIVSGNNITINGNIHSNSDISMGHAILGPGSVATAVRNTNPSTEGWIGGQIALDMPSFSSFERATDSMYEKVEFPGTRIHGNMTFQNFLNEAIEIYESRIGAGEGYKTEGLYIHVNGSLIFGGSHTSVYYADYPIVLLVDGDIVFNGACMNSSVDYPIALMSKNGSITVNGGGAEYTGIIYAPNGDVILNGNDAVINGSIVAKNIRKSGGKITVNFVPGLDGALPETKVHLIK